MVLAPFPFKRIGNSTKEIFISKIHHPEVKTFPHPLLDDQPASVNFVGKLEPIECPDVIEASNPTHTSSFFAHSPDQPPACFDTSISFAISIMDDRYEAIGNEELHSFNHDALEKLFPLVGLPAGGTSTTQYTIQCLTNGLREQTINTPASLGWMTRCLFHDW